MLIYEKYGKIKLYGSEGIVIKDFGRVNFKWTFRDYQKTVLDNSRKHLKDRKIHIVAAPGSGKTILGLELIRRLGAPALVLSPSVSIRQQWGDRFAESFLPESENKDDYLSFDLKNPGLITSVTYQALHAAFSKTSIKVEDDEDALEIETVQDFSDFELLDVIKKAGVSTLCLDEAHHLKSEWQRALEKFIEMMGNSITVISLTATPPYDSTPQEWERYSALCGEIDEEIFVPQLVAQKTLCPHQDYIYFSYPTLEEIEHLNNYKEKARICSESIIFSGLPMRALEYSGVLRDNPLAEELLFDNLEGFKALVKIANQGGMALPVSFVAKVTEGRVLPVWNMTDAEKAFQFIIDNPDIFGEGISKELQGILSENALVEKRKVCLTSNDKLRKMLASSMGKLESIEKITLSECENLGDNLRMLILTDFIKRDMLKIVGTNQEIHTMGAVPVFEAVRRILKDNTKLALLTGSLVIVPQSAVAFIQKTASEMGVHCVVKPIDYTLHSIVDFSGSNKNKVGIITKTFGEGYINILVGTKSLLGEGWDSPNINSLILASFVGSFMLSNQMRGRAIRIDKAVPDKVSNIWHLVTVEPGSEGGLLDSEPPGTDFETIKRRFSCFQAPAYSKDVIESGMDRIDIIKPPFTSAGFSQINSEMLRLASNRAMMSSRWGNAVKGKAHPEILDVCEVSKEIIPKNAVFKNKLSVILLALIVILSIAVIFIGGIFGALGLLLAGVSVVLFVKKFSEYSKNSTPEKTVKGISAALLKALRELGEIDSASSKVIVTESDDSISLSLEKATVREKNVFAKAVTELLSPIDNPRYLLIGTNKSFGKIRRDYIKSFSCPSVIGVKKENVAVLAKHLKATTGTFELVFTRSESGRKELIKCRKLSYINLNGKAVQSKKTVKK